VEEGLNKYPRSGLYRENRDRIAAHAKAFEKNLDTHEGMDWTLLYAFQIHPDDVDSVTEEERQGIRNFALFAGKRLSAASLQAPKYQHLVQQGRADKAINSGVNAAFFHDELHAMFAYQKSRGESFTPAYLRIPNEASEHTNLDAIQEEITVLLWQMNFISLVMAGKDPLEAIYKSGIFKLPHGTLAINWYIDKIFKPRVSDLRSLASRDPIGYYLGIHEAFSQTFLTLIADGNSLVDLRGMPHRDRIENAFEQIEQHRDPDYVHLMELMWHNVQTDKQDSKLLVHEFQRILKPVLDRLRAKQ